MNAIDLTPKPTRGLGVYTTSARDERSETDVSRSLTMRELAELRWRYTEVESDLGIRSTFGTQLEVALAQRISDEAMQQHKAARALLTKLRNGWRPKEKKSKRANKHNQSELVAAFVQHVGLDLSAALQSPDANVQSRPTFDASDLSDQLIYMHSPLRPVPPDPYESDRVFFLVRRLREIDRRRREIGPSHDRILQAVYGNSMAGDDWRAFKKPFAELVDVVIAIVASERQPTDPPARAIIRAQVTDDRFVRRLKQQASGYLRAACTAYAETRS